MIRYRAAQHPDRRVASVLVSAGAGDDNRWWLYPVGGPTSNAGENEGGYNSRARNPVKDRL